MPVETRIATEPSSGPSDSRARATAVVICCYTAERYDDVVAAVRSVREQEVPGGRLLLVVDHDDALLGRLRADLAGVEVVASTGAPGLSGARNTALALVEQPYVAFLDDDAVAAPGWLDALTAPFADPAVAGTGGRLDPAWDAGRPVWFPPEFDWVVGCSHPGQPAEGGPIRNPIGANMAFRTAWLRAAGGFEESMGRIGTVPVGAEETEAAIRIAQQRPGTSFVYVPGALARHRVRAERGRWSYFRARCWGEGLSKAIVRRRRGPELGTEQGYVREVLLPGAGRALRAGEVRRALAIVLGLAVTVAGYAAGLARTRKAPVEGQSPALRVAMVTAQIRPAIGGVEAHVSEVASRLVDAGLAVELVATDRSGELPRTDVVDGVPARRYAAYPRSRDYYLSPGVVGRLLRGRYDVVHVQGVHTLVAPLAMLAALVRRVPYVLTFHTGGNSIPGREQLRGLQFRLLAPLLRRAAALVAVSEFEARRFEQVLGWEPGRIQVIRNGGSLPPSTVAPAVPVEIATVGRLERYKGHHRAIEAMPVLLGRVPGIRLRILGAGSYEPELRALAERLGVANQVSIELVAPDDRQAMADALSRTSVVLLLSDYEAHPVAVMEALTLARPVVLLNTSGLTEIGERGWALGLPASAGPAEVAAAVERQLADPVLPDPALLPTWETCAEQLAAVLRDAAR